MRWDFGFTCPFCLLHESDLADATGVTEGTGLTWIEHRLPQSSHGDLREHYENCFYSCRYCNRARGTGPIQDAQGRQLLDPTCVAWADHFELNGDRLACRSGDVHAAYTHETYDLDEQRKIDLRAARAELIRESLQLLENGPLRIAQLLQVAQVPQLGIEQRRQIDEEIEDIRRRMADAQRDLQQRAAIPRDANRACRCRSTEHHELPLALESQMLELDVS